MENMADDRGHGFGSPDIQTFFLRLTIRCRDVGAAIVGWTVDCGMRAALRLLEEHEA